MDTTVFININMAGRERRTNYSFLDDSSIWVNATLFLHPNVREMIFRIIQGGRQILYVGSILGFDLSENISGKFRLKKANQDVYLNALNVRIILNILYISQIQY